ncbi:TetR/AcrR family transcriptional regulator [Jiangella rhizosphaerae]|uniref:TetR/AcrR family transcriptional regulator n=1 Tax=Jiangella rhizosphaerae TaxID=2293569 RepID=A0A418KFW2_9ACTN|nr:TetR/AcrR family transcriptional regulator [Jiangella rhizosphaerae]RIQ10841.1 TetR/AcrR family transcriptional regulator [Jiangella rhizosphaerae]
MDTRQRIIEATAELLRSAQPGGVSTRDICRAAGITPPTLYHHFGDKEGLYDAVAAYGFDTYLNGRRSLSHSADPVEILIFAWDAHIEFGLTHPSLYTLMFGSGRTDADTPAALRSRSIFTDILARVARAGRLRIDIDQATLVLEAAVVGTTLQAIRSGHDPAVAAHLRTTVLASLVTGIAGDNVDATLTSAASQLAASLDEADGSVLKPVEMALLKEWLRLLATATVDPRVRSVAREST